MRRREFITLIGGGAAAWPLAARAQQGERIRRIGVLNPFAENDPQVQANITAFRQALTKLGWTDGHSVRFHYRWGGSRHKHIADDGSPLRYSSADLLSRPENEG